jgi:hypothetical protein
MKTVGIFCVDLNVAETSYDDHDKSGVVKPSCPSSIIDTKGSYKRILVRKSYGRGAGSPMICSSQYEKDGALCYDHCDKRYDGVGSVCCQYFPSSQPISCAVGCSITPNDCTTMITEMFAALTSTSMGTVRLKIVLSLIQAMTDNLIDSATKNDGISVAGNISILSNTFAETIVSDVAKKGDP